MLKVVVLPAPFGPSNPTISPALTLTETPLTTRRPRYSFISFSVTSKRFSATAVAITGPVGLFFSSGLDWVSLMRSSLCKLFCRRRSVGQRRWNVGVVGHGIGRCRWWMGSLHRGVGAGQCAVEGLVKYHFGIGWHAQPIVGAVPDDRIPGEPALGVLQARIACQRDGFVGHSVLHVEHIYRPVTGGVHFLAFVIR